MKELWRRHYDRNVEQADEPYTHWYKHSDLTGRICDFTIFSAPVSVDLDDATIVSHIWTSWSTPFPTCVGCKLNIRQAPGRVRGHAVDAEGIIVDSVTLIHAHDIGKA